jgi:RimJ/RimL family protein N-acetyltransferase
VVAEIRTPRLVLVPASIVTLEAQLESREALAGALRAEVPESWPPEHLDADAVRWSIAWLERNAEQAEWGFYYFVEAPETTGAGARLAGAGGYKGPPDAAGGVELGYAVVEDRRRRGYASEAVRALLARAFGDARVTHVVAHTLPELTPSIGVLRATGFEFVGKGNDPYEPNAIKFEIPRERFEQGPRAGVSASRPESGFDLTT